MRKAIGMSGLLAAILAAGPVCAQNAPRRDSAIVIMPDGTVLTEESSQIAQMRRLQRQMTEQVQERISRELRGARTPYDVVEIPDGFPRNSEYFVELPTGRMIVPAQWEQVRIPTEKAAYMGIATAPVSTLVREQLKLHRGMGLVVQYVEKGSPAAEAGLLQNDILEKLDDQLLVNTPQFTALVRAKKPGDEVTLSVIRAGEHVTAKIKLAEKEVPVLEDLGTFQPQFVPIPAPPRPGVQMNFGAPPEVEQPWQHGERKTVSVNADGATVRRLVNDQYDITLSTARDNTSTLLIKDHAGREIFNGPFTSDPEKQKLPVDLAPLVKDLGATEAGIAPAPAPGARAAITRVDAHHRITLEQNGSEKRLIVVELPDNKTLYDGPPDGNEVNKLPADVREKIEALEQKVRIQVK